MRRGIFNLPYSRGVTSLKSFSTIPILPTIGTPIAPISVHKGYKIETALCISRPPLQFIEPTFLKEWREFNESWKHKTKNNTVLTNDIVYMGFPDQFLLSEEEKKKHDLLSATTGASQDTNLDILLNKEKSFLNKLEKIAGRERTRIQKVQVQEVKKEIIIPQHQRFDRAPYDPTYLILRNSKTQKWSFPTIERIHGDSIAETLNRICTDYFESEMVPFIPSACPIGYEKRRLHKTQGLEGRKIFYFRGILADENLMVRLRAGTEFDDFAFATRAELEHQYFSSSKFNAIKFSLPL